MYKYLKICNIYKNIILRPYFSKIKIYNFVHKLLFYEHTYQITLPLRCLRFTAKNPDFSRHYNFSIGHGDPPRGARSPRMCSGHLFCHSSFLAPSLRTPFCQCQAQLEIFTCDGLIVKLEESDTKIWPFRRL